MPRHDSCHDIVAEALLREGWQIRSDIKLSDDERVLYIDLRALRGDESTLIEVKCFPNLASPDEQYTAVGQYLIYHTFLRLQGDLHPLYIAVPVIIYEKQFDRTLLETLKTYDIRLILFDETRQGKLQWITWRT